MLLTVENISQTDIQSYIAVPIVLSCFAIGYIIKNHTKVNNSNIPTIMAILGCILNIIFSILDGLNITYSTVITGIVSGFASSGLYDAITRILKLKKENDTTE